MSKNLLVQWSVKSKVGNLYLVASDQGLTGLYWKKQSAPLLKKLEGATPAIRTLKKTVAQLEEYFAGDRLDFDLAVDWDSLKGTEFQKQVWAQLRRIPYGKTLSYRDIAKKVKRHRAVRAVGSANGRNPLSIIVPCHRVITSAGTLGGYAGGIPAKTWLLEHEKRAN